MGWLLWNEKRIGMQISQSCLDLFSKDRNKGIRKESGGQNSTQDKIIQFHQMFELWRQLQNIFWMMTRWPGQKHQNKKTSSSQDKSVLALRVCRYSSKQECKRRWINCCKICLFSSWSGHSECNHFQINGIIFAGVRFISQLKIHYLRTLEGT